MQVMEKEKKINGKKTLKDIFRVLVSNFIKAIAGIAVGFLLPKVLDVADYGYYKIFNLYVSYVGLFHFGFVDGIYLKYGGQDYEELDKKHFRALTSFLMAMEFVIAMIGIIVSVIFLTSELRFIFICISIYLFFVNLSTYYQFISEITSRFKLLLTVNILYSILTGLSVPILYLASKLFNFSLNYQQYTLIAIGIYVVHCLYYISIYTEITFGEKSKLTLIEIKGYFKLGIPLLIAGLCNILILSIDRQFVNFYFTIEEYAIYSFAYSMVHVITVLANSVSTVLYPTMKRMDQNSLQDSFPTVNSALLIVMFLCLMVYFPLIPFVNWFLSKYTAALPIFRITLPSLAISSSVTIIMHNYYKTDGKETEFFLKTMIIIVLSIIANSIAYHFFKSMEAISIASVIVSGLWYFIILEYFIRVYHTKWVKEVIYIVLMVVGFYLITIIDNWLISLLIYLAYFLVVTLVMYKDKLKEIKKF